MGRSRILIIDDELEFCLSMKDLFEDSGYSCIYSTDPEKAADLLRKEKIDLVLLDYKMPRVNGIELLSCIREENSELPIILVSGYIDIETTVQAMRIGALNVLRKPVRFAQLEEEIARILNTSGGAFRSDSSIISGDKKVLEIFGSIKKVAETNAPVLITGESGTGKELIAEEIHRLSGRTQHPFVKLNCAALPESLLESELFGHKKGAFTGALENRSGRFIAAHQGSLFLDEIGDMNLLTQAKLLRVLQDGKVTVLGSDKPQNVDVRIIAATNKNLFSMMKEGLFREDLFYRLSVVHYDLPPLRERSGDILLLSSFFLEMACYEYGRKINGFDAEVEKILLFHPWPGNIRELKNCIQRAVIFCENTLISAGDLPEQYKRVGKPGWTDGYEKAIDNINRELIEEALRKSGGKKALAAQLLKIDRKTLYNKIKKLNIQGFE